LIVRWGRLYRGRQSVIEVVLRADLPERDGVGMVGDGRKWGVEVGMEFAKGVQVSVTKR